MKIEILSGERDALMIIGEFPQVPRVGEYVSIDREGYFKYYNVVEVWYRDDGDGVFKPCIKVELDD